MSFDPLHNWVRYHTTVNGGLVVAIFLIVVVALTFVLLLTTQRV